MCPWPSIDRNCYTLINVWSRHKNLGMLPFPGELRDQPAWVAETIEALDADLGEAQTQAVNRSYTPDPHAKAAANPLGSVVENTMPRTNVTPPVVTFVPVPERKRKGQKAP